MDLSNLKLTKEQIEKASACKTPEEILAFAQDEGLELTDEQLEAVAGGKDVNGWGVFGSDWFGNTYCPFCNSFNVQIYSDGVRESYECRDCGKKWDFNGDFAPAYSD